MAMMLQALMDRVRELQRLAAEAAAQAERERQQRRQENDQYVMGGVNWNGYSLESLIKMVAERASPNQLDALADEWRTNGQAVSQASTDLQRSLDRLMNFWSGASAENAARTVTTNARWMGELGQTAEQMAGPIETAGGALRSAQDTMPGKPSDAWYAGGVGGGALAGFAIGGPIGAAFGAAIGGIASAFGFGSSKRKLKRKAVQTMQRFETAVLGIDQTTPQFGLPSDGVDPGGDRVRNPGPGVGTPTPGPLPPGSPGGTPLTPRVPVPDISTLPSFGEGGDAVSRWRGLTGGPTTLPGFGPGGGPGFGPGLPGLVPGVRPPGTRPGMGGGRGGLVPPVGGGRGGTDTTRRPGRGMPTVPGGIPGRGGQDAERRNRAGRGGFPTGVPGGRGGTDPDAERRNRAGRGGFPTGVPGARGAGDPDGEHRNRAGRGGYGAGVPGARATGDPDGEHRNKVGRGGYGPGGLGAGIGVGDEDAERRGRGRFGRGGGVLDPHGAGGYGPAGAGTRKEEDEEHHRKFPVEEDPFSSSDLKAAPPVIGL